MKTDLLDFIEYLRKNRGGICLAFSSGKIYWLYDHYKYLDVEDAPKVLIGNGHPFKGARQSNKKPYHKIIYLP